MAQLNITGFTLTPLYPDLTVNAELPVISGTVPTFETVDFAAMGQHFKLELECSFSGTYPDSSTAENALQIIRYNPALFAGLLTTFSPPGSFPFSGYSLQIPSNTPATYDMRLINGGDNTPSNENGTVTMEVVNSTDFVITHVFRVTMDVEDYILNKKLDNRYRLSKNSQYNALEDDTARPSVFGSGNKALNAYVAAKQGAYNLFAQELSLEFSASFAGFDQFGISEFVSVIEIARVATPATLETNLSPFEDNIVTVRFADPGSNIELSEASVILTSRATNRNIATFENDLDIQETILRNAPMGALQLEGPIYEPVTYTYSGGETSISFIVKGTDLIKNSDYQLHINYLHNEDPSENRMGHVMSGMLRTDSAPRPVDLGATAEIYSRNGNHAENFTATVNERVTALLTMSSVTYDADAQAPFSTFAEDIDTVQFQIIEEDEIIFNTSIQKGLDGNFTGNQYIGVIQGGPSDDEWYFYLKEVNIPYMNYQGLSNWEGTTHTFRWNIRFMDQTDPTFGAVYTIDSYLSVRGYENDDPSPSEAAHVENIRFLDPSTGLPIANWCALNQILVIADIPGADANTYVSAMVDRFPLGVSLFNDYAKEEENPATHPLPTGVIFTQKASDLITELDDQPTDGSISFLLDISELSDDEKMRIYVEAYQAP